MIKKIVLACVLLLLTYSVCYGYGHRRYGYRPVITYYNYGTSMYVGPVVVYGNRRYVRFGINVGFSRYGGFSTFNYYTGKYRYYKPNGVKK